MRTKTKISLRIDDELLKVLKENSTGNLTAYIEELLLKGLITDLAAVNEQIKLGRDFENFINNTRDEFEAQMTTSITFIQDIIFRFAVKQGLGEQQLREHYEKLKALNSTKKNINKDNING